MERKNNRTRFLIGQGILALLLLAFPVYRWWTSVAQTPFAGCLLHDVLRLYCPTCGGTRAIAALLRLDFLEALRYHAYLTLLCVVLFVGEVVAWIRFFLKKEPIIKIPRGVWILGAALLVVFFLARNVLLVGFGVDPIGDLGGVWSYLLR